jgi:hypothetical protein
MDVAGQYQEPSGQIIRERTKLLVIVVSNAPQHVAQVRAIAGDYAKRFGQHTVFHVERSVCVGAVI